MRAGRCAQDLLRRGLRAVDLRIRLLVKADLSACAPESLMTVASEMSEAVHP